MVKKVPFLRLTYQIRLLAYMAASQRKKVILVVPESCLFSAALADFVSKSSGAIVRDRL